MALLRNFVFTINNYDVNELKAVLKSASSSDLFSYSILGLEVGTEGTPHIQGYAELVKRTRRKTVSKIPGFERAYLAARLGSAEEASTYCMKGEQYQVFGEISNQGARPDLDRYRALASSEGMRAVCETANLQQIRTCEKYLEYNEEQREWMPEIQWFYGPTGTGKSKTAREILSENVYTKNTDTKWWTGYDGHDDIIIDDFRPSWWSVTYMLGLLDRYPFQLETKGGQRQMLAKRIIVTSALHPKDCYRNTGEAIEQLLRRISVIREFVPEVVPEVTEVIIELSDYIEHPDDNIDNI